MSHYDQGTREADLVIRGAPEMVDFWLQKARRDRRRWNVRLLRPELRQFLDGFLAGLEAHVERTGRSEAVASPPAGPVAPGQEPPREAPAPPPPPAPEIEPQPAEVSKPAESIERVGPSAPQPDVAGLAHPDRSAHDEGRAIGVLRLSSRSIGDAPQGGEAPVPQPAATGYWYSEPDFGPSAPAPAIVWSDDLEQARAVGVVDLSAYEVLDHLGELPLRFSRRERPREGLPKVVDPRAR